MYEQKPSIKLEGVPLCTISSSSCFKTLFHQAAFKDFFALQARLHSTTYKPSELIVQRWKVGTAVLYASSVSDGAGRCFLLAGVVYPESAQLCTSRAPPCASTQSLGISNTSDKPRSTAVASKISSFFPQKKLFLCWITEQLSNFSQPKLTANKLSFFRKIYGLCEASTKPFPSLSWGLSTLDPYL